MPRLSGREQVPTAPTTPAPPSGPPMPALPSVPDGQTQGAPTVENFAGELVAFDLLLSLFCERISIDVSGVFPVSRLTPSMS